MRLIVLESPFAGDVERNLRYARACLRDSLSRNESPIASHLLYTQPGVLNDQDEHERAHGIAAGFAWRMMADASVFYRDLGMSRGMLFGLAHAEELRVEDPEHAIEFRELGGEWTLRVSP